MIGYATHPVWGEYTYEVHGPSIEDKQFMDRVADEVAKREALDMEPVFSNKDDECEWFYSMSEEWVSSPFI